MARITIRNGSEGPRHDPYHFEEITLLKTDGTLVVGHFGLQDWLTILRDFGQPVEKVSANGIDGKEAVEAFEKETGLTLSQAHKAYNRIRYTCRKCGCRRTKEVRGYPGESLNVCAKCEAIVSTDFDESAII